MAEYFDYDDEWNEAIGEEIEAFLSSSIDKGRSAVTEPLKASERPYNALLDGLNNLGLLK